MTNNYKRKTYRRGKNKSKKTRRRTRKMRSNEVKIVNLKKNSCIIIFSNAKTKNKVMSLIRKVSNKSRKKYKGGGVNHFITSLPATTPTGTLGTIMSIKSSLLSYTGGFGAFLLTGALMATLLTMIKKSDLKVTRESDDLVEKAIQERKLCKDSKGRIIGEILKGDSDIEPVCYPLMQGTTSSRKAERRYARKEAEYQDQREDKKDEMKMKIESSKEATAMAMNKR